MVTIIIKLTHKVKTIAIFMYPNGLTDLMKHETKISWVMTHHSTKKTLYWEIGPFTFKNIVLVKKVIWFTYLAKAQYYIKTKSANMHMCNGDKSVKAYNWPGWLEASYFIHISSITSSYYYRSKSWYHTSS